MTLLTDLASATEGSRELDGRLAIVFEALPKNAPDWLVNWKRPWGSDGGKVFLAHSDGRQGVHWQASHYTTSLDAKLPGENIVQVSWTGSEWEAFHYCEHDDSSVAGIGKTEVLSRRIAILKAQS